MGISLDRAIVEERLLATRIADAFSAARSYHATSAQLNEGYARACAGLPKGAPRWLRSYGEGVRHALTQQLYHEHLVYGGYINGTFYSTHSNRPDYYEKCGIPPSAYAEEGAVERRGHYWADDTSKPFFTTEDYTS